MGAIVFIVIGVAALLAGAWQGVRTWRFLDRAVPVIGHVVPAPEQRGSISSAHPIIEFVTPDGATIRYRQNGMGAHPLGTPVSLLYDRATPDTAVVQGFWTLWFPVLGPLLLGFAFLAVPLFGVEIGIRGARP